jgi:formylglycine-generating enzyme required for sulfatase activity
MRLHTLLATLALAGSAWPAAATEPDAPATTAAVQPSPASTVAGVQPSSAVAAAPPESASTVAGTPPSPVTTTAPAPALPAMVQIPGGTYTMGEPGGIYGDTGSIEHVAPFLLDTTEVTVAGYAACVRAGACRPAAATIQKKWSKVESPEVWSAQCNRDRADRADHPVNCVDWDQARAYCAWAGKRLPSSAEWEWAARNGKKGTRYPWGKTAPAERPCWSGARSGPPPQKSWWQSLLRKDDDEEAPAPGALEGLREGTCPVASHPEADSALGVKDLTGNVWEWTSTESVVGADSRGRGGSPVKIARGGGWADRDPEVLRVSRVAKNRADDRGADLGFRCAKDR